jgi:type II secretory pathway pseudopilin PulG
MKKTKLLHGFTVVEMLIVIPIVIVVIGIFIGVIVSMTGEVLATRANNAMAYNIQDALDRIRQDVSMSGGFLATNNITLTSPQGYNNDTTNFHNADAANGNSLILNAYTTTSNPTSPTKSLVYASGQPNQCNSSLVSKNSTVMMNIIYFTKTLPDGNTSLWRRVVAPSRYQTASCSIPWQQPTCALGQSGTLCKTNDIMLIDHLPPSTGFSISYYTTPGSTTNITNSTDSAQNDSVRQTAISTATTISVTITANDRVAGRDISQTGTARIIGSNTNITATTIPTACPTNFVRVPGSVTYGTNDFCAMKYEAKNVTGVATSQAALTPWASISQTTAITTAAAACAGCHLITDAEWLTIAQNALSVNENWSGGKVGSGYIYSGHNDSSPDTALAANTSDTDGYYGTSNTTGNQRRTLYLTNGEVIWDIAGNLWEWTSGTIAAGKQPGLSSDATYTDREWNEIDVAGSLNPNSSPSLTGLTGAEAWDSANGIGIVNSYTASATTASIRRGGMYQDGDLAGVLNISLNRDAIYTTTSTGFRAAK